MANSPSTLCENEIGNDNTKPFARMGRKAYRVSPRQPGRRMPANGIAAPAYFLSGFRIAGIRVGLRRYKESDMKKVKDVGLLSPLLLVLLLAVLLATPLAALAAGVTLRWDPSPDADITGYKLHYQPDSDAVPFAAPGGASIDSGAVTSAYVDGLDPLHSYYFAVTAYNSAGEESVYSNVIQLPEALPPTVSITSPANDSAVSGVVSISASASDNVGVAKVQFLANGALLAESTAAPFSYSWNTASLPPGPYTISARALDAAGNVGVSRGVVVTVAGDTVAPAVSVAGPANGATVGGSVTLSAGASDNIGVTRIEISIDGAVVLSTNQGSVSYTWDTAREANGSHTVTAKAYDAAGNVGFSAPLTVTVLNDLIPPTVAITSPGSGAVLNGTVAVAASASDNTAVSRVEFEVNGVLQATSTQAPYGFNWNTSAVANGSYSISAKAYDVAGNVGYSQSVTVSVSYDRSAPVITSFSLPAYHNSTTVPIVGLTASDNVQVTGYRVTDSAVAPSPSAAGWSATVPATFTFSGTGSRTAYAWARDAAGNVSAAGTATVVVDSVLPVISYMSLASGSNSVTMNISATDDVAVGRIELYLDKVLQTQVAGGFLTYVWSPGPRGNQTVTVMVYDKAGNLRSRSLKFSRI